MPTSIQHTSSATFQFLY